MGALTSLGQKLLGPVQPTWPVVFARVGVGVALLISVVEERHKLERWALPGAMRVPLLEGFPALPAEAVTPYLTAWVLASLFFLAGCFTRAAGVVLVGLTAYHISMDQQTFCNHNYLLMLEVLFLTLANAGAVGSVDAWRHGPGAVHAWPIVLVKVQISVMYLFAGLAKVNDDFLSGAVLYSALAPPGNWLALPESLRTPAVLSPLSYAAVIAEVYVAFALWLPNLRLSAFLIGPPLHMGMLLLMAQPENVMGMLAFAVAGLSPYLLFSEEGQPHRPVS
jgi:hypothetical protein